jgi:hypothetical protein
MTELDLIEKKIKEHEATMLEALIDGNCKDFSQYQKIVGTLHGLALAKYDVQELRKRLEKED